MRIASFLQVIDDIDSLALNIEYHRSIGVDYFLICDRGASAADRDRLMVLAEQDDVRVFKMDIQQLESVDQQTLPNHRLNAYRRVFDEFEPDWVLFSDVDEFWVPESGNLATTPCLSDADVLTVPRFNAALEPGQGEAFAASILTYENLMSQNLVAKPLPHSGQALMDNPNERWIMRAVGPKIMSRVRKINTVLQGFHGIECSQEIRQVPAANLAIVHYPFTSLSRFTNKVENIRAHLHKTGATFNPTAATHWRRWSNQLTDLHAVEKEYQRQFFSPDELHELRRQGVVQTTQNILTATK